MIREHGNDAMRALIFAIILMSAGDAMAEAPQVTYPPAASARSAAPVAPAAPDKSLGMALMSAVVNYDGTLVRGVGAVSATKVSSGYYVVAFERAISDCTGHAIAGAVGPNASVVSLYAQFYYNNSTSLTVLMKNPIDGASYDGPFHLLVFCPK